MARIITYEDDPNISDLDRLIGSDGNDYNITKNFTLLGIAEYVIDVFVNPDATDFHIPVFNSNGTRITDSIMHQDSSPSNGVPGTIITVDGNFSVVGNTVLGTTVDNTTIVPSTLRVRGKMSDKNDNLGVANQILMSDADGYVQWGPECGVGYILGQGTTYYLPLWTPDGGTLGDSLVYQIGDNTTPATEVYFKGGLASEGSKVANISDIALGTKNFAGGENSTALNFRTSALGNDSFASGHRSIAGGHGSLAAGYDAGAGNYGFGFWAADATDTTLDLKLVSGSINAGDFIVANVEADPSIKHEILTVTPGLAQQAYTITIAQPITVNLDAAVAIEEAVPDRGDELGAIALGYGAVSKGTGSVAIGRDSRANAANQIAIGSGASTVKLEGTTQDNTQDKVLVIDANTSIVKYRSALTISPELGWDTVAYTGGNANWIVDKYNGYMEIPFGVVPPAKREVRPSGLTTGEEGYFVFVANSADIPADFLDFTSVNSGNINRVRTTWSGSGTRTYIPNNQNAGKWIPGTAVKFHYIVREEGGITTIFWDACCEIQALNDCPIILNPTVSHTINEDQVFTGGLPATDGDGPLALEWLVVSDPDNGTLVLDSATGNYTYTPDLNYSGTDYFEWYVFDGGCYSQVGTVTFTISDIVEFPAFKISNGLGNNCGADDVAPLYTGTAGGSYVWEGNYCDPDHAAADVTITTFYDVGGSWVAGLPANWTFDKDDVSGVAVDYRFTLESSNVASGLTRIKLEIEDAGGNVGTPYILEIGAAFDTLTKTEILLDYSGAAPNSTGGDWYLPGGAIRDNIWDGKKFENLSTDTYNGHTNIETAVATGVSPSGGTLTALYPSATYTIRKITGGAIASLEFYYTLELDNGPLTTITNNIDPGLTIQFDATKLNTAFSKTGTGNLTWTIQVEDILRAPLASGNITNVSPNISPSGHTCNDGGFALIAWGYDLAGIYHSFLLRKYDVANANGLPYQHQGTTESQFFASETWDPPYAYISTPAATAGQCTTPTAVSTWWNRTSATGWHLAASDVDETNKGAIWDKANNLASLPGQVGTSQNNYSYIPATQLANYNTANNSTAGIYRMDTATATAVASTITSGKINFMVVGLGFTDNNPEQNNCDPAKIYQAWVHADACQMRIFTENAGGTNQIEVKDGANSFLAGDGKYVELDVYSTPGSNATVYSF